MGRLAVIAALLLGASEARAGDWDDAFDRYATGSLIAGQGGWETWDNNPAFDTIVTDAKSLTTPNSLLVAGSADVVQQVGVFGEWDLYAWVYIPATQTGEVWVRLANTYAPGGPYNFSVRLVMCVAACTTPGAVPGKAVNIGGSDVPGVGSAPLVTNQWVLIHVVINSSQQFGYNYLLIYNNQALGPFLPWGAAPGLKAVDFLSTNSTEAYIDNVELQQFLPVELMSFTVN